MKRILSLLVFSSFSAMAGNNCLNLIYPLELSKKDMFTLEIKKIHQMEEKDIKLENVKVIGVCQENTKGIQEFSIKYNYKTKSNLEFNCDAEVKTNGVEVLELILSC